MTYREKLLSLHFGRTKPRRWTEERDGAKVEVRRHELGHDEIMHFGSDRQDLILRPATIRAGIRVEGPQS